MRRLLRGVLTAACLLSCLAGIGAARAESGTFFKNLFGGGGSGGGAAEGTSAYGGAKLYDPSDVYCPNVSIRDGAAAVQAPAGAAGDNTRLHHQITFARISRECGLRPDGTIAVKVGVGLRALLGPAGAPGSFEAPLTVTLKTIDKVLVSHTRRIRVTVPAGSAQGAAATIEDGLVVPAADAANFDIVVALAGTPAAMAPKVALKRSRKPAAAEASAEPSTESAAPATGQ